jgi:hypothetical protein
VATARFKSKKWRIIGSIVFALLVILIVLITTPILGGGNDAQVSAGVATKGGFFSLREGAYH